MVDSPLSPIVTKLACLQELLDAPLEGFARAAVAAVVGSGCTAAAAAAVASYAVVTIEGCLCFASMLVATQRLALVTKSQAVLVPIVAESAIADEIAVESARRHHELAWPAGEALRWSIACVQLVLCHLCEVGRVEAGTAAVLAASVLGTGRWW